MAQLVYGPLAACVTLSYPCDTTAAFQTVCGPRSGPGRCDLTHIRRSMACSRPVVGLVAWNPGVAFQAVCGPVAGSRALAVDVLGFRARRKRALCLAGSLP